MFPTMFSRCGLELTLRSDKCGPILNLNDPYDGFMPPSVLIRLYLSELDVAGVIRSFRGKTLELEFTTTPVLLVLWLLKVQSFKGQE